MPSPAEIGQRIRAARKDHGLTQEDLAAAVGVSRSAVAQWETGRAGQLTPNLARIADALGVGIEALAHGEDKHAPAAALSGDELAMLRLYRECSPEDRQILLHTARRLARGASRTEANPPPFAEGLPSGQPKAAPGAGKADGREKS